MCDSRSRFSTAAVKHLVEIHHKFQGSNADRFLASNRKFVYAADSSGRLLILDRQRGTELGVYDTRDFLVPIANVTTDRLLLGSHHGLPVTVNYATADSSARGGFDYVSIPSGMLTFAPGQTVQTVNVTVNRCVLASESFEYTVTVCKPETRTETVNVTRCVPQVQARQVSYTVCVPKAMTGVRTVVTCRTEAFQATENFVVCAYLRCCELSGVDINRSVMPITPLSGVRSSCEMLAKNSLLARLAVSASTRAACSCLL